MALLDYKEICSRIPDNYFKVLIENVITKAGRAILCKTYSGKVSQYFKGFRHINAVPIKLLSYQIKCDSRTSLIVARTFLSEWFRVNLELISKVKKQLSCLGYQFIQPDFSLEAVKVNYLQEIHSLIVQDKLFVKIFEESYNEYELIEITLATILLGFFPAKGQHIGMELLETTEEKYDTGILDEIKFSTLTEKLKEDYLIYLQIKKHLSKDLENFSNYLQNGEICQLSQDFPTKLNSYNESVRELNILCDQISNKILNEYSTLGLDSNQIQFLNNHSDKPLEQVIESVLKNHERLLDLYKDLLKTKAENISTIMTSLDQDQINILQESINKINNINIPLDLFENNKKVLEAYNLIEQQIMEDINSFNFREALNKLSIGPNNRAEKYILNFLEQNCTKADQFFFLLMILPLDIYNSFSDKEYFIKIFVQQISTLTGKDLSLFLREDIIFKRFENNENGRILIALTSILVYFFGDFERASTRLYSEGVYQSIEKNKGLLKLVEAILNKEEIEFYDSKSTEINNYEVQLNSFFNKEGNYPELFSSVERPYRLLLETTILPKLQSIFKSLKTGNQTQIESIKKEIDDATYSDEIYYSNKSSLPKNIALERKIVKNIDKIVRELIEYANLKLYELPFQMNPYYPVSDLLIEFEDLFNHYPLLSPLRSILIEQIHKFRIQELLNTEYSARIMEIKTFDNILGSSYYYYYCPELSIKANSSILNYNDIFQEFRLSFNEQPQVKIVTNKLFNSKITKGLGLLTNHLDINEIDKLHDMRSNILNELNDIETEIRNVGKVLPEEYYLIKNQERWILCKEILLDIWQKIKEDQKRSSEIIAQRLEKLSMQSAQLRVNINTERNFYTETILLKLFEGLKTVDEISNMKMEHKINLAESIIHEIEHLRQFKNETIDQLNNFIEEYNDRVPIRIFDEFKYLQLPLNNILKSIETDDYLSIGLNKKQWGEISSDRKEYISELIESWIYLSDKPTTKDDIHKNKLSIDNIETECKKLVVNLCSICTLYKNNDGKKIGQDPMIDWNYSTDLPFVYTTKIQSPRCSSLDKPIRFYIITQSQISSKKYINRIKDFISEKKYDQIGFNVLILLGDKERFLQINTNSITKNLPLLDDISLKRILFSTAEKKIPKWEFVSLLTLNKKISSIQPFKTQGSVDSNTGIFVGRNSIIREIISSQKDFAIYGGRKIGKSSLLSVVRNSLVDNGYAVSYQSFQGIDNSLTIAKSIIEDLKERGLKYTALLKIDTLDDFSQNLLTFYRENDNRKVVIILDEMDELIHKEKKLGKHQIIEVFRNISQKTTHLWRFIFAGYKEMYLEIQGKGIYTNWKNPWQNFIDDSNMQLSEIESPRELIDEGLKDILGLEYDKDIIDTIANYSTGHPAFLQKFCECLVKSVDNRISHENRRIFKKDVIDVFERDTEFIRYVKSTLDSNLSDIQELITVIAAIENKETFTRDWVREKLLDWINTFEIELQINSQKLELEIELLTITGVVKRTNNRNEYKFAHPHYIVIIKKLESVDKNLVENLIYKIKESNETKIT